MPRPNYDPQKAHEYYIRTRELKGREKGSGPEPSSERKPSSQQVASAQARVAEIQSKLTRLREILREKIASSSSSSSSEKSTTADKLKDRQDSKEYYEKHKNEIKNDRASEARKSGGGGSSSRGGAESMTVSELKTAIRNTIVQLKKAISDARRLGGG